MLLALVLAASVAPAALEWVEISQQHYRKPAHKIPHPPASTFYPADEDKDDHVRHTLYPTVNTRPTDIHIPKITSQNHKRPIYEEPTIELNIPDTTYPNQSISEHNWNDHTGNIKRIVENMKIRPNITPEFSLEIYGEVTERVAALGSRLKDQEAFSATVERVPNKGSVRRVQLSNTPVKSSSVISAASPIRRNDIRRESTVVNDDFSDEFEIKADIFKNVQDKASTPINHVMNIFSGSQGTTMWQYDRIGTTSDPVMNSQNYPQVHRFDNRKMSNNIRDRENILNVTNVSIGDEKRFSNKQNNDAVKVKPDEETKQEIPNAVPKNDKINKLKEIVSEDVATSIEPENNVPKGQKAKINTRSEGEKNRNEEIKVNTMENVLKFVKVVADTISKNTRGVNGKVKYLNQLKDTLLSNIKERIEATWPDDADADAGRAARRRARSSRGHVEFPSSESSLMTISFLTFAVFLIKLVLQVIQTYKNKTMMVAPLVVATAGRALPKLRKNH